MQYLTVRQRIAWGGVVAGTAALVCAGIVLAIRPRLAVEWARSPEMVGVSALLLLMAVLGIVMYRLRTRGRPTYPEDFHATVHHRNIALDHVSGILWLRTPEDRELTLHRDDILSWQHKWMSRSNYLGMRHKVGNRLILELDDAERSCIDVDFARDFGEASQWRARIAYWKKHGKDEAEDGARRG